MNFSLAASPGGISLGYSILSAILLTFYGTAVCPYIDSLPGFIVFTLFIWVFAFHAYLNSRLIPRLYAELAVERRPFGLFLLQSLTYLLAGIVVMFFDNAVFNFPLESGLKVIVGTAALGLFASLDVALATERRGIVDRTGEPSYGLSPQKLFPVTRKLAMTLTAVVIITSLVLILVLVKDTHYLLAEYAHNPKSAINGYFLDVSFVMGVILLLGLRVLFSYAQNLRLLFDLQVRIMGKVGLGELDVSVPIVTRDEFSVIARETNQMIASIREKERMRATFGKIVAPQVAEQLLSCDQDTLRNGFNLQATILYSDIRGFTTLSESVQPGDVVQFLNEYYSEMIDIVSRHHGVVDKMIGDGLLAVFGLGQLAREEEGDAVVDAVEAALEMRRRIGTIRFHHGEIVEWGIGLHRGQVIAGTIGSPQRFEFTVIGDTVNTANRIEGLCKRLQKPLVISADVFNALPSTLQSNFVDQGEQAIRGRSNTIRIFSAD